MGNSSKKPQDYEIVSSYNYRHWRVKQYLSYCQIWENQLLNIQGEAYQVPINWQSAQLDKYTFRTHNNKDIVGVYHVIQEQNDFICTGSDKMYVLVERIPIRLDKITRLSETQALTVLLSAYSGYNTIGSHYGPVFPDVNCICFTESGKPKVWVNPNLSLNTPIRLQDITDSEQVEKRNRLYTRQIFDLIAGKTFNGLPELKQIFTKKQPTYFEGMNILEHYAETRRLKIPQTIGIRNVNVQPITLSDQNIPFHNLHNKDTNPLPSYFQNDRLAAKNQFVKRSIVVSNGTVPIWNQSHPNTLSNVAINYGNHSINHGRQSVMTQNTGKQFISPQTKILPSNKNNPSSLRQSNVVVLNSNQPVFTQIQPRVMNLTVPIENRVIQNKTVYNQPVVFAHPNQTTTLESIVRTNSNSPQINSVQDGKNNSRKVAQSQSQKVAVESFADKISIQQNSSISRKKQQQANIYEDKLKVNDDSPVDKCQELQESSEKRSKLRSFQLDEQNKISRNHLRNQQKNERGVSEEVLDDKYEEIRKKYRNIDEVKSDNDRKKEDNEKKYEKDNSSRGFGRIFTNVEKSYDDVKSKAEAEAEKSKIQDYQRDGKRLSQQQQHDQSGQFIGEDELYRDHPRSQLNRSKPIGRSNHRNRNIDLDKNQQSQRPSSPSQSRSQRRYGGQLSPKSQKSYSSRRQIARLDKERQKLERQRKEIQNLQERKRKFTGEKSQELMSERQERKKRMEEREQERVKQIETRKRQEEDGENKWQREREQSRIRKNRQRTQREERMRRQDQQYYQKQQQNKIQETYPADNQFDQQEDNSIEQKEYNKFKDYPMNSPPLIPMVSVVTTYQREEISNQNQLQEEDNYSNKNRQSRNKKNSEVQEAGNNYYSRKQSNQQVNNQSSIPDDYSTEKIQQYIRKKYNIEAKDTKGSKASKYQSNSSGAQYVDIGSVDQSGKDQDLGRHNLLTFMPKDRDKDVFEVRKIATENKEFRSSQAGKIKVNIQNENQIGGSLDVAELENNLVKFQESRVKNSLPQFQDQSKYKNKFVKKQSFKEQSRNYNYGTKESQPKGYTKNNQKKESTVQIQSRKPKITTTQTKTTSKISYRDLTSMLYD